MNTVLEILTEVWVWNKKIAIMLLLMVGVAFILDILVSFINNLANKLDKK